MRSTTIATALLASVAIAQPHGHFRRHHHEKRDLVVEWTTEWVTETVYVDSTTTPAVAPSTTPAAPAAEPTTSATDAQFYESPSQPAPEVKPTAEAPKPPAPEPVTSSPPPPPVVVPTTLIPAPAPSAPSPVAAPPPPPPAPVVAAPPPPVQSPNKPAPPQDASASSASSSGGGSGGGKKFTGDMTYYQPGMGSCGYDDSTPKGNVVAVSKDWFMSVGKGKTSYGVDQPANILCDKTITISAKGKTTTATIRDSCPGCAPGAIDVTESTFMDIFGSLDAGRSTVTWWLNEPVAGA